MNYDETWGISYTRVLEYFSAQEGLEQISDGVFRSSDTMIELTKLPERKLGSVRIPVTSVKISGGDGADRIHRAFYLRFLSAGG